MAASTIGFVMVLVGVSGCASTQYHFDPTPAPAWTQASEQRSNDVWTVVGAAQVSRDASHDVRLASEDGKAHLAMMLSSDVRARSRDASWSSSSGEGQLVEQRIDVDSTLRVEGAMVGASYRDEATQRQLVQVTVDVKAWRQRVIQRFAQTLVEANVAVGEVRRLLQPHAGEALRHLLSLQRFAERLEADAKVLSVLGSEQGLLERASTWRADRVALTEHVNANARVSVNAPAALQGELITFLGELGLRVVDADATAALRITASVSAVFQRDEIVGRHTEHVYAATGEIAVADRQGSYAAWAVQIPLGQTTSDVSSEAARQKAEDAAHAALVAKFRSKVRQALR